MIEPDSANPQLTVGLALAAGMVCQAVAQHLRVPGIIVLLAAGVLLGPDVLGWVQPSALGPALDAIVGFAVAIILFEGGLNLHLARLRSGGRVIRRLLTIGPLVTVAGGAAAAHFVLGWPWRLAALFGTLVIVTGPTVVTPLLKRLRVKRRVANVLEAEGVLIDAIGAIVAVVALEFALRPAELGIAGSGLEVIVRLGAGSVMGLAGGAVIVGALRIDGIVPEGLENILTLALVTLLFQVSNTWYHESGLAAVTVAGVLVGNARTRLYENLREFKEQLTVMLIGLLFVLLAADVRLDEVRSLGWAGVLTVAALILVVRPVMVALSAIGSDLTWRERAFVAWIGPRGIVAAAVASLFASELARNDIAGGSELRALVFLAIALTVLVSGFTGGLVARRLGLGATEDNGYVVLGAQELGRTLAQLLDQHGRGAVCVDINPEHCRLAQEAGLTAFCGDALEERMLNSAEVATRTGIVGLSPNEELNLKFVERAHEAGARGRMLVGLTNAEESVTPAMVHAERGTMLFGRERDLDAWSVLLRHAAAKLEAFVLAEGAPDTAESRVPGREPDALLPLALLRDGRMQPVDESVRYEAGDTVWFAVNGSLRREAMEWLSWWGWEPAPEPEAAS